MSELPDPILQFEKEREADIARMANDQELRQRSLEWMIHSDRYKYSYNFRWLGRPIIKYPGDIVALQEIIWTTQPDLIIETGIAHGGSLVLSASILELLGHGVVVGVDIDIRGHNRSLIENHPLSKRITMIEGSSLDPRVHAEVIRYAADKNRVMVCLDSNHTHDHVLAELMLYADLVTVGSYLVLPDTFIEFFPAGYYADRPWDVGNNPYTALMAFLASRDDFAIDRGICDKLLITEAVDGYLRRTR